MPVQITVTMKNGELIQSNLIREKLAIESIPSVILKEEMELGAQEAGTYPDELPNQRYERTGARGRRTRLEYGRGNNQYSQSYTIKSDPTYRGRSADPYVLGDAQGNGQAAIHQGRWGVLFEIVQRVMERVYQASVVIIERLHSGGL